MKKLILIILFVCPIFAAKAFAGDDIDSLKQQLQIETNDSLRAGIYSRIASHYMQYDAIFDKKLKRSYQNEALGYTFSAIRLYSKFSDTTNLRISFDNLVKVYHAQKKYSPAKWYVLQSNALSRAKRDTLNIIASLIELASIKSDIKDYKLAMRDLNEALSISKKSKLPQHESLVQQSYAALYTDMNQPDKAAIALKRHDFLEDSIKTAQAAAQYAAADSAQTVKKKYLTVSTKRAVKTRGGRKVVSL